MRGERGERERLLMTVEGHRWSNFRRDVAVTTCEDTPDWLIFHWCVYLTEYPYRSVSHTDGTSVPWLQFASLLTFRKREVFHPFPFRPWHGKRRTFESFLALRDVVSFSLNNGRTRVKWRKSIASKIRHQIMTTCLLFTSYDMMMW